MNGRIERDYRDLYRLAILLQRVNEQTKGQIEMLKLRKGADGVATTKVWDGIKAREDELWGAVDRVRYFFVIIPLSYSSCVG